MKFLGSFANQNLGMDYAQIENNFKQYWDYISSIKNRLPDTVYNFVVNDWHYNPASHNSLHDSWIERLEIMESDKKGSSREREINIQLVLLGAFHDGYITIDYKDVCQYEIITRKLSEFGNKAHGDLDIDEITLSNAGNVIHELIFSGGTTILIECQEFIYHSTISSIDG